MSRLKRKMTWLVALCHKTVSSLDFKDSLFISVIHIKTLEFKYLLTLPSVDDLLLRLAAFLLNLNARLSVSFAFSTLKCNGDLLRG